MSTVFDGALSVFKQRLTVAAKAELVAIIRSTRRAALRPSRRCTQR